MKKTLYLIALIILAAFVGAVACAPRGQERTELRVLFAGSLIVPFDDMERAFEEKRPDVDVLMEGHGSIQCIRHVTELEELADVVAVADYALIPMMMYETSIPFLIGPEGQAVMERNQHPVILPPVADGGDAVPAVLRPLVQSIP